MKKIQEEEETNEGYRNNPNRRKIQARADTWTTSHNKAAIVLSERLKEIGNPNLNHYVNKQFGKFFIHLKIIDSLKPNEKDKKLIKELIVGCHSRYIENSKMPVDVKKYLWKSMTAILNRKT